MITRDKMNVVAQRFEPDPRYVDYWIDLSMDPTGNVIKSYSDNQWLPLNRKADLDLWRHIQEIVDAVGLERTEDDEIVLPDDGNNVYFIGDSITELLTAADKQLNEVTDKLEDTSKDLEAFKATKGQKNGLASLDENGTVPRDLLPAYVDDVIDVYATFHVSDTGVLSNIQLYKDKEHTQKLEKGEPDKIYVNVTGADDPWIDDDTVGDSKYKNIPYQFRWSGTQFVHIDCNVLILGQITGTAFDGGRGKAVEDTIHSIDKLVLEITTTPTTSETDVKIKFKQGQKDSQTGKFTYTDQEVTLAAANSSHAGVMSKDDKATVDTASSLPTDLISTIAKNELTDHHDVTFTVKKYNKLTLTGKYTESSETLTITNATNSHAGTMSLEDHTYLWTTLPGNLEKEKTDREAKEKEITDKHDKFETAAKQYKTETEATLTEIKENLKNIADKTGLTKPADGSEEGEYGLPDSEASDKIIKDAETVFEAVEKLDKFVSEDCVHWTKETDEPERKVIVLPQHSSLKGTVPDSTAKSEPKEKTLHIASINSLNTNGENPPSTVQQVEIGNTDLHLDLKSNDRPTVEVMESTTAYTNEVSKIIYDMLRTGIMTMDNSIMPISETLKTTKAKTHKHVAYSQDELWYGVKFDMGKNGGYYDGTRTGNLTFHKELPIQSKMRGCTIDDKDDSIKYLQDTDWKKYADGSEVKDPDGSHINFFVEIPEHYRLFLQTPDNNIEIRISEYNLPGYTHVEKKYIGAYEATTDYNYADNELEDAKIGVTSQGYTALWSRPDWQKPVVSLPRESMQKAARKSPDITGDSSSHDRSNHWNMYTYDAHTDMTWLFVVEYATLYSLKDFTKELTPEGYHQGGLGPGVTKGLPQANTYSWIPCGVTHVLGSSTGVVCYDNGTDGGNKTLATACQGCDKSNSSHFNASSLSGWTKCTKTEVPRYRGIENPFGHVWKNTVDVIVSGQGDKPHDVYICRDWTKFKDTVNSTIQAPLAEAVVAAADGLNPPEGYNLQIFKECPKQGYLKELVGTNWGDLFAKECNGSATKYYTDYHLTYTTDGTNQAHTLLIGGRSDYGSSAGLFRLDSDFSVAGSSAVVGTRLTFYGEPTDLTKQAAAAIAYAMQPQYGEGPDAEGQVDTHTPLITIPHDGYVMNDDNPI